MEHMLGLASFDEEQLEGKNMKGGKANQSYFKKKTLEGEEEGQSHKDANRNKGRGISEEDMQNIEDHDQGFAKAAKLALLLDNKNVQLRSVLEALKSSLYGTPIRQTQLQDLAQQLQQTKEDLQVTAIQKKAPLSKVKEQLLEAAKLLKSADREVKATKSILDMETASNKGT